MENFAEYILNEEDLMQKMEILEDIRLAEDQLAHGGGISQAAALKQVLAKFLK